MKNTSLIVLFLIAFNCHAAIYMQTEENGNIIYSDTPKENSQPVSLTSVNSVPPPAHKTTDNSVSTTPTSSGAPTDKSTEAAGDRQPYTLFTILSPTDNESIQNQPSFSVKIGIDPKLQADDTIQVYIDGQPWGQPTAGTEITLQNITRGEHTLFAKLLDKNNETLKQSSSVTIYVHQVNANFRPRT